VEVGPDDLIGEPGDYHRQPWFTGGSIRFAAVQLGGAEALWAAARAYVQDQRRIDDPYHTMRAAQMALAVESGNLWLRGAAEMNERPAEAAAQIAAYANMMRSAIEQICLDVIRLAERSIGARGMLRPHPAERIIRDLTMYLRQPAPDAALAQVGSFVVHSPRAVSEVWHDESGDENSFDVPR
jgi:alkylation response protein AidB-like acyl-CoA dehydrogenase